VDLESVFINKRLQSDSSVPAAHRAKLVITGLVVR